MNCADNRYGFLSCDYGLYCEYNDKSVPMCYIMNRMKSGHKVSGKEVAAMNTVIRNAYYSREHYEALRKDQGLYFMYLNKITRKRCCVNVL